VEIGLSGLAWRWGAIQLSRPRRCTQATFGTNRLEVLAAVVNALPLFGVLAFLLLRAGAKTSLNVRGAFLEVLALRRSHNRCGDRTLRAAQHLPVDASGGPEPDGGCAPRYRRDRRRAPPGRAPRRD